MTKPAVLPERYEEFITGLQLVRLRLVSLEAKANVDVPDPRRNAIYLQGHASYEVQEDGFEAYQTYEVAIRDTDTDTESGKVAVVFALQYETKHSVEPDELGDLFEIFSKTSLLLHVYPYVRQLVQDVTTRMDWPPVILPIATPANGIENAAEPESAGEEH